MKSGIWCAALILAITSAAAHAREVSVRSGEHNSFTRVVVLFPPGTNWNARQDTTSITLTATGGPWEYDLSTAFRLIPRSRILSMDRLPDGRSLRITTTDRVHMASFGLSRGGAVIDVSDATAPTPALQSATLPPYWRAPTEIRVPDERIQQAERDLLSQLGRAAAQGAVQVDPNRIRLRSSGHPNAPQTPQTIEASLGIIAQTVMDRDTDVMPVTRITPQGQTCAPDHDFDPAAWLDKRPFAQQISDARQKLVGEFDRPDQKQVTQLAKVYVALGMGAEAQSVLRAFSAPPSPENLALAYIAAVQDGAPLPDSPYTTMLDCSGRVTLWAFMGASDAAATDFSAVYSGFSSLPDGLRNLLGPELVAKLIRIGAIDTAESLRNTLRRSNSHDRTSAQLAEAELDITRNDLSAANRNLAQVAQGQDTRAARALALRIDAMIDQGNAVPDADTQRAADFARLLGQTEQGFAMRRAESLGAASVGNFDHAFSVLADLPSDADQIRDNTQIEVLTLLSRVPDDALFLSRFLPRQEDARRLNLSPDQRIAISKRLATLGFGPESMHVLTNAIKATPRGRIAVAQAALASGNTALAITELSGLTDPDAITIRADALSGIGEHAAAARLYAEIGDPNRAAQEAWRSGSSAAVAEFGTETQKAAVQRAGIAPSPTSGPLSRATDQIAQSQADRAAFETLLRNTPAP